ncbi:serine/threonine-protein kinase PLK4 [Elysia marginata]|uniref:Serine/threonine-protein kinase PLK4 n=1 Tax=Elysia marginata TaxID=1093978 RepID=A0AAV4HP62_9GAST|nr:serine/threonine-protein kinase PLK4 [Elysia marginata]
MLYVFDCSPQVEVYQNLDGVASLDGCPLPGQGYKLYTYPDLPSKQMKKYQHVYKFVELVKSRTAKVVLVTDTAQCKLMENSKPADFKADFHNGSSVVISKSTVTVTDRAGGTLTFDTHSVSEFISPDTLSLVQYAHMCHHKCLEIERSVRDIHTAGVNNEMFPVIIGSTRSPYQLVPVCSGELTSDKVHQSCSRESPLPPQAQRSGCPPQACRGQWESSVQDGSPGGGDGFGGTSGSLHRTLAHSVCSEAELCDLLEGHLTEFGGSSRGSSVKNMSRSVSPQTRSSTGQCGELKDGLAPVMYQQFPASILSVSDSHTGSLQHQGGDCSSSTVSYEQTCLQSIEASVVPSPAPQSLQHIGMNSLSPPRPHDHLYSSGDLDCSIRSSRAGSQHQHGFSTPQYQQQQDQGHNIECHSVSHRSRLLQEHRNSLVSGQLESEQPALRVRRALFSDLDLDLSLPISSPVPTSGTHALQHDLLAIQRTPSLDLSDCSDGPDGARQLEEDQFLELPSYHQLHVSAPENCLQEFNTSLAFSVDPLECSVGGKVESSPAGANQPKLIATSVPKVKGKAVFEQTDLSTNISAQDGTISMQMTTPFKSSNAQTLPQESNLTALPSPQKTSSSFQGFHQENPPAGCKPPSLPRRSLSLSSSEISQMETTGPRISLGSINNHRGHLDTRRGSSSSIKVTNPVGGCCSNNNSSSNESSNTSGCLDILSPQLACVPPSLPPQLRHSLDMSASSHYSDSSAPSSSCAGDVVRQLFVPYTGWASLHATGAVWILYNDGTQVGVKSSEPAMIYVDQDGTETRYCNTDAVPEIVRLKLEKLPSIVDQLMKAPVTLAPGQLSQPGGIHKV